MKNKRLAALSILLCFAIVITCMTACGKDDENVTTTAPAVEGESTWAATPTEQASLPMINITGAALGDIVEGALGEEYKDFMDDNLNNLTQEQIDIVTKYAESLGCTVEKDGNGDVVVKGPVEDNAEDVYIQASVSDPSNMTPEEQSRVSQVIEQNSLVAGTDASGNAVIGKPVLTTAPKTTAPPKTDRPAPLTTQKKTTSVYATATFNVASMGTTLHQTSVVNNSWTQTFGGQSIHAFSDVAATKDGGSVCVGVKLINGAKGIYAPVIAKFDAKGTLVWQDIISNGFDGNPLDNTASFDAVAVLTDGSIVAVGYTSAGNMVAASGYPCPDTIEGLMVKYNANGNRVWTKLFGGSGDEEATAVCAAPDGGFYIGSKSTSADGNYKDIGTDAIKAVLFKCDKDGKIGWNYCLSGTKHSSVEGISIGKDGNIFLTIDCRTGGGDYAKYDKSQEGRFATVVVKLNSSGKELWSKYIYESGRAQLLAVETTDEGGCVIAGFYSSIATGNSGVFADTHNGGTPGTADGGIVKFDKDGKIVWKQTIIGFENDFVTDIVKINGGYAVAGYTASTNRDFISMGGYGDYDGFIYAVSEYGALQTLGSFGGSGVERVAGIASNGASTITACGLSYSGDGSFAKCSAKGNPDKSVGFAAQITLK